MEIDDPIVDQQSRAATPLFVDPETGAAFGKETFASEFISLIRLSLLLHHGKRFTLAEVRRLWSLHSFRITGLNLLEKAGCPPWLLRIAGRWLSDCHYQYTRQDHNLLATVTASMDQQPDGSTPLREFPSFPFPVKHIPDSLPQHPDTRKMTQPGQTQVDATLTAEATTSSWLLPGAFNTDAPELMDVPNTMVGRRIRKFFPGKGWFEGTVTSTSAGTGVEGSEREQTFANVQYDDGDFEQQNLPETELYLLQTRQERKSFQKGMGEPVRVNPRWPPATQAAGQHELYPERLETALSHID